MRIILQLRHRLDRSYSVLSISVKGCHREASELVISCHHWHFGGTGKYVGDLHTSKRDIPLCCILMCLAAYI